MTALPDPQVVLCYKALLLKVRSMDQGHPLFLGAC